MRGMSEGPALRVAVSGGSIGGLAAATALHAVGCEVNVHERTPHSLASRGAGIVVQPELAALLREVRAGPLPMTGCTHRRHVEPDGGAGSESPMPQRFTSWEAIYGTLLAAFPRERYHLGSEVVGFDPDPAARAVAVRLGSGATAGADLLVCADGWRSPARGLLLPEVRPAYAGYVAFRGTLDEAGAPEELVAFFDDRFTFSAARSGGHALCYPIPGEGAAVERGRRRFNWVWYVGVAPGKPLDEALTDRSGRRRAGSVPPGELAGRVDGDLRRRARAELHPLFGQLVAATPEPFLQVIVDLAVPRMLFGRACLLGDAAFIVRPHTAGATAKAASDASALAAAAAFPRAELDAALARWERGQLAAGRAMSRYGISLGERFASAAQGPPP